MADENLTQLTPTTTIVDTDLYYAVTSAGVVDSSITGANLKQSINIDHVTTPAETTAGVTIVNFLYPEGYVLRYGTNTTPGTTDMTTAIQAAVDVMEANGAGDVILDNQIMLVSDTITVNGPIWLRGSGASFEQIFTASPTFAGSVIKLAASSFNSSSKGIIEFDYTGVGSEARLHAGASNVLVFGNRGTAANPTDASATNINSFGIGFHIKGARYVTLDHCFGVWCAEDGVKSVTDTVSSNNITIKGGGYISNADDGLDLSGGDSFVSNVQLGFNGGDGFACAVGVISVDSIGSWDNFAYGLRITADDVSVSGGNFYDNQLSGILVSGTRERISIGGGVICQDNGKDTGQADQVRSGIYVSGATTNSSISCVVSANKDETGSTGQVYGLRITSTSADVKYSAISGDNNGTALVSDLSEGVELTIATGAVTSTKLFHRIDTEGDAASDDLDTINGGYEGQVLTIKPANGARTVVAKDGTGNLQLSGSTDFSMDEAEDTLTMIKSGSSWLEVGRSDSGALSAYTPTNVSTDRSFDADTVVIAELADVVGTLIADLQSRGQIG